MTDADKRLRSAKDLAEYLEVQEATLRQWRWQGRGPRWIKVGGYVRYDMSDVEAWLESQKSGRSA